MNDTLTFLQALHGDQPGYLFLCNVKHVRGTKQQVEKSWRDVPYPVKHLDKAAAAALNLSKGGKDTYASVRQFSGEKRVKGDCLAVTVLYADGDGCTIPEGFPEPSIVIETSPGHFHFFWILTRPISPDLADDLGERIARRIGADPSGWDSTQVLRIPGTRNYTQPGCPIVNLVTARADLLHDPAVFEALPPNPKKPAPQALDPQATDIPPLPLDTEGTAAFCGLRTKRKDDGSIDRSGSLVILCRTYERHGLARHLAALQLAIDDERLGWCKYTGRTDAGEQYAKIVALVYGSPSPKGPTPIRPDVQVPPPDPVIAGARASIERDLEDARALIVRQQHMIQILITERDAARADFAATIAALQKGGAVGKTIIGIAKQATIAYDRGTEPGEPFMPYRDDIGKWAGVSPSCVSTHLGRLEDREALVKIPDYVKRQILDKETGEVTYPNEMPHRRLVVALGTTERSYAGIVTYLLSVPEQAAEPKQGGLRLKHPTMPKRLCPDCKAFVETELHEHCGNCLHDFGPIDPLASLSEQNASIEDEQAPCGSTSLVEAICVDRPDWRAEALADVPVSPEGAVRILTRATPLPAEAHAGTCSECGFHMWLMPADAGRCRTCTSVTPADTDVSRMAD